MSLVSFVDDLHLKCSGRPYTATNCTTLRTVLFLQCFRTECESKYALVPANLSDEFNDMQNTPEGISFYAPLSIPNPSKPSHGMKNRIFRPRTLHPRRKNILHHPINLILLHRLNHLYQFQYRLPSQ